MDHKMRVNVRPRVSPESALSLHADLSTLSMNDLYALSNRVFKELDRRVPHVGSDGGYYELMAELDAREALDGTGA